MSPGQDLQGEEALTEYIKDNAWGHHACCSAKMGSKNDKMAVLDSKFRVRGVDGLRVVDASVFPVIPGIFVQAPVMMIAEKAADAILGTESSRLNDIDSFYKPRSSWANEYFINTPQGHQ